MLEEIKVKIAMTEKMRKAVEKLPPKPENPPEITVELWRSLKDMRNAGEEEQETDADAPPRQGHEVVTEAVTRC